jgi:hypothetical protein
MEESKITPIFLAFEEEWISSLPKCRTDFSN